MLLIMDLNVGQTMEKSTRNEIEDSRDGFIEAYLKIDENLYMLSCIADNLQLISSSDEIQEQTVTSTLFSLSVMMNKQLKEIENKLDKSKKEI